MPPLHQKCRRLTAVQIGPQLVQSSSLFPNNAPLLAQLPIELLSQLLFQFILLYLAFEEHYVGFLFHLLFIKILKLIIHIINCHRF